MWIDIANSAHQMGGLSAMAGVCLLQYVWHMSVRARLQRERDLLQQSLIAAEGQLNQNQDQTHLVQFENKVLCDLLIEPSAELAARRLLQAFVSRDETGVAAFFGRDHGWTVRDAVGLNPDALRELVLDSRLVAALAQAPSLVLDQRQLEATQIGRRLSEVSGRRLEQLYLLRASPVGEPLEGIVVASSLPECGGGPARQLRITERLLAVAGRQFRRTATAAAQEQELRVTREILELRSLVDLEFHTPQEMVEQFLNRLTAVIDFEHASVYMLRRKDGALTRLARFVAPAERADGQSWGDSERRLAHGALGDSVLRTYGPADLEQRCIRGPFLRGVTVPMRLSGEVVGMLALTGKRPAPLVDSDRELLVWAAEYLLDTILKTIDRASLQDRAVRDGLTGLANRHAFDAALENQVERALRLGRECSLILLDLDHFKQINDRYGHPAGDDALRCISQLILDELRLQVRGTDHPLAARYGGEELAVILPGVNLAGARRIAESIRRRVEQSSISSGRHTFRTTLSGGVAAAPAHGEKPAELLASADAALYRAKREGRNRIEQAPDVNGSPPASPPLGLSLARV